MIATSILGNEKEFTGNKPFAAVNFEWFELEKKRIMKTAEDGMEIGVTIEEPLHHGDIIAEAEDKIYVVKVLPCRLIKISVETMEEMGRLGFELGNRHLSLEITENEVKVPFDMPTYEYLKKLGFCVEDVQEQFANFIECKAHGHSHSHVHHAYVKRESIEIS